ncbi:hypothetical protein Srot_1739 [Segniliparus rotundus DSM 44985]|uniref:Tyr recombinase domain-containing protein n=1 Tax=Segniliparus rotundus (strain ATCC BAA-972 / CDC 1076 / CIP 108378 / DSM 44985 / JCM 13578) TaxID=640132 RepID=D6Z8B9_SEGRD|nr:hypothetical protein [Segniliparus rotundus]ADG98199.1 hypothetical protein Srot_1739 [Segniliparus rotundus DSM 44985]
MASDQDRTRGTALGAARRYVPHLPAEEWAAVEGFVTAAVEDCSGQTAHSDRVLLGTAVRLVHWAWRTGLPLERPVVFHRSTIVRFIAVRCGCWTKTTRNTYRSRLLRMGEVLAPECQTTTLPGLSDSSAVLPYSSAEQAALRSWATGQRTAGRRADAKVLLALGMGAGLMGGEIVPIRRKDIVSDQRGILVQVVGRRQRLVPVLAAWEEMLLDILSSRTDPEAFVFRPDAARPNPNVIAHFTRGDGGEPSTSRMRTTWIVGHLTTGVPARALIAAAGVDGFTAFQRCIPYLPEPDSEQAGKLLRRPMPSS